MQWLDDDRFVTANEGDSRAAAAASPSSTRTARSLYESGAAFEYEAARLGHYPEARNKKGIEPEGLEVATFGDDKLIFVGAERASLVGVYKDTGAARRTSCRCCRAASARKACSPSRRAISSSPPTRPTSREDGLAGSHVMIYERAEGSAGLSDDRRRA